jgi:hypothetical protein
MQPVWVLSVDLQTKTATFQSGLGEAARSARGAFSDIKSGSQEMGSAVSGHMMEARHGVMLLGEEFGVHLPRGVTTFLASIGPVGAAMEAAFPFLAIAVGATLLLEHLAKLRSEGEELTQEQVKFGTAIQNAFNQLDEKLISAQIKADELRNDHLGALRGELELIDKQSMDDLLHAFDEVAKSADVVFGQLTASFYQFGIGSDGAKHALDDLLNHYTLLQKQGKDGEASGLLTGTLKQAQQVLAAQQKMQSITYGPGRSMADDKDSIQFQQLRNELKAKSAGWTDKEVASQQALVEALQNMVGLDQRRVELKKLDSDNATHAAGNAAAGQQSAAAKEAAESAARLGELAIGSDRAAANAQLEIKRASIEERLKSDIEFVNREQALHLAANDAEIAALDKSGKDYANQLKALHDKAIEITAQANAQESELKSKALVEIFNRDLRALEENEREKIDATQKGSAARLAAIEAAIKEEESKNLQDTSFYRDLLTQRVEMTAQMAQEEAKRREEAGKEESEDIIRTGEATIAAEKQANALRDSARRVSEQQMIAEETQIANQEFAIKQAALEKETQALDKNGKEYLTKLKAIQDKEKQMVQQHENEITAIKEKAQQQQNQQISAAMTHLENVTAQGLTQVLMGHESFAKMMTSIGDQVVSGMIQNAIKSMMALDMDKEKSAAKAARAAYNIGMSIGGPAGIVLGPVFGAAAFAAEMAFNTGTDRVPGVGTGDVVPAMLTPGEGVVPGGVMDGLRNLVKQGGLQNQAPTYHVHVRPTYHVNTIDGDGMEKALKKHTSVLQKHFASEVRRMNHY